MSIEGSEFKAVNNRERNETPSKIERRERELEEGIQCFLDALKTADRTQPVEVQTMSEQVQGKIRQMRQCLHELQTLKAPLENLPDRQQVLPADRSRHRRSPRRPADRSGVRSGGRVGVLLVIALTLELLFLGVSAAASLFKAKVGRVRTMLTVAG